MLWAQSSHVHGTLGPQEILYVLRDIIDQLKMYVSFLGDEIDFTSMKMKTFLLFLYALCDLKSLGLNAVSSLLKSPIRAAL